MPWLDTGVESGKVIVDRYALAGYRNRIFKLFRHALARYRNRVWKCGQQICPGWIQESNLELVVYRYALARYRYRIWNFKRLVEIAFLARYRCRPLT